MTVKYHVEIISKLKDNLNSYKDFIKIALMHNLFVNWEFISSSLQLWHKHHCKKEVIMFQNDLSSKLLILNVINIDKHECQPSPIKRHFLISLYFRL